jgi:hypothetical protein
MAKIPVIDEVSTSLKSLGHAITGDVQGARDVWHEYAKSSVVGSSVHAAVLAGQGRSEEAATAIKGAARATGRVILPDLGVKIPVLHELGVAGRSLGNAMAGDTAASRQNWHEYAESSVVGSGIYAGIIAAQGDSERAREVGIGMGKATASAALETVITVGTVLTGGVAAPLGLGASIGIGSAVGATASAGGSAAITAIEGKEVTAGNIVGAALNGAAIGAAGGAIGYALKGAHRAAQATSQSTEGTLDTLATGAGECIGKGLGGAGVEVVSRIFGEEESGEDVEAQEEENRRRQEEARQAQEEENRRRQEEARQAQEEENRRRQEEVRQAQEEESRRRQEEARQAQEEENRRRQEEARQAQEEDNRRRQEEARQAQEEDNRRCQEEAVRVQEKAEQRVKEAQKNVHHKEAELKFLEGLIGEAERTEGTALPEVQKPKEGFWRGVRRFRTEALDSFGDLLPSGGKVVYDNIRQKGVDFEKDVRREGAKLETLLTEKAAKSQEIQALNAKLEKAKITLREAEASLRAVTLDPVVEYSRKATKKISEWGEPVNQQIKKHVAPPLKDGLAGIVRGTTAPIEGAIKAAGAIAGGFGYEETQKQLNKKADQISRSSQATGRDLAEVTGQITTAKNATRVAATAIGTVLVGPAAGVMASSAVQTAQGEDVTRKGIAINYAASLASGGASELASGLGALASGAAGGAAGSATRTIITKASNGEEINADDVFISAAKGAAGGAVSTGVGSDGSLLGNAANSALSSAASDATEQLLQTGAVDLKRTATAAGAAAISNVNDQIIGASVKAVVEKIESVSIEAQCSKSQPSESATKETAQKQDTASSRENAGTGEKRQGQDKVGASQPEKPDKDLAKTKAPQTDSPSASSVGKGQRQRSGRDPLNTPTRSEQQVPSRSDYSDPDYIGDDNPIPMHGAQRDEAIAATGRKATKKTATQKLRALNEGFGSGGAATGDGKADRRRYKTYQNSLDARRLGQQITAPRAPTGAGARVVAGIGLVDLINDFVKRFTTMRDTEDSFRVRVFGGDPEIEKLEEVSRFVTPEILRLEKEKHIAASKANKLHVKGAWDFRGDALKRIFEKQGDDISTLDAEIRIVLRLPKTEREQIEKLADRYIRDNWEPVKSVGKEDSSSCLVM